MQFTKKTEIRIKRILEITVAVVSSTSIIFGIITLILGNFSIALLYVLLGFIGLQSSYSHMIVGLPRAGALVQKRRFWP